MLNEIHEQPDVVARMTNNGHQYREACARARRAGVRFVIYVARGTSDNAAVYGGYLTGTQAGLPAALASPSVVTVYRASLNLRDCLVIGLSQSGQTRDVADYLINARDRGAFTIAITNDGASPLASSADAVLLTDAGPELSIAATKTYTSQLAALALFWAAWVDDSETPEMLGAGVPRAMSDVLNKHASKIGELATRYRFSGELVLAARGYNYTTCLEAALKLKETCYLGAAPYSAADLMHGPVAVLDKGSPVLLFAPAGASYRLMETLAETLLSRGVEIAAVARAGSLLDSAIAGFELPGDVLERLSPLIAVLPAQYLAYRLALEKNLNPDRPRGLSKVTGV